MNLKKSSSFLLGVLMLFPAMPARAGGDGRLSSSRTSEERSCSVSCNSSWIYHNYLSRIRENKHNIEKLKSIFYRIIRRNEIVDRKIRDFKSSRTEPLSRDDRMAFDRLMRERVYIACVYHMSNMYVATEFIERQFPLLDAKVRNLMNSMGTSIRYLRGIVESCGTIDPYEVDVEVADWKNFCENLRIMMMKVQHRLSLYEYRVKLEKVSRDNAILDGAVKELLRDNAMLEGKVKGLLAINALLGKNVALLEALVLELCGKRG